MPELEMVPSSDARSTSEFVRLVVVHRKTWETYKAAHLALEEFIDYGWGLKEHERGSDYHSLNARAEDYLQYQLLKERLEQEGITL